MKGRNNMDEMQFVYRGEFTIEQRKIMTAQILQELRKNKKLSQKEVAAHLNIPATTYNTYESGRTEPPIEILVRLSYLYSVPVDFLVQRNRTYRTSDDIGRQIAAFKDEIAEIDQLIDKGGVDDPKIQAMFAAISKLADAMESYTQTEAVKNAIDKPVQGKP